MLSLIVYNLNLVVVVCFIRVWVDGEWFYGVNELIAMYTR
ncbi:hypothetical protein VCR31J2_1310858 [Vibrio coralliirubri]|uniref:Uncharacterized protein n=1 Tax=Vibrio coralliirubri TaxID=1516159 RepID=A0AA87C2J6_9VIBR|nr:hypothetical protein VCR31J2_1310858 [Vibrio coralliirubri]